MSAYSELQIAIMAARRLGVEPSSATRLVPLVAPALKSLARRVAGRDDFIEGQKTVNVSSVAGVVTITDDTLMLDTLAPPRGSLVLNNTVCKPVRSFKALKARRDRTHYWYVLLGRAITVADVATGATNTAAQPGTLTCNYQFSLAEMPPRYDDELVAEVAALAQGGAQS